MQLNKGAHYQDNQLFPEHLLVQELSFPQNSFHQLKPNPPPLHHEEQFHPQRDSQNVNFAAGSSQLRFYQQFRKIYTVSHHLALEKARQAAIIDGLKKRIKSLEDKMRDAREKDTVKRDTISDENRAKRSRRTAEEIQKRFKLYGSEGSLQQHIKLKHPQLYQKSHNQDSNQDSQL